MSEDHGIRMILENMLCRLSFVAQITEIVLEHTGAALILLRPCLAHGQLRLYLGYTSDAAEVLKHFSHQPEGFELPYSIGGLP